MARVLGRLRGAVISPEMVVAIAAAYMLVYTPEIMVKAANVVSKAPEAVKYMALLPAGVLVWSISEAKSILLPGEDRRALLVKWPRYGDLRDRVIIGLLFQCVFTAASFMGWVYSPSLVIPKSLVLVSMGVIGSAICAATLLLASLTVRGILKRENA